MTWKHLATGIGAALLLPAASHAATCATLSPSPASQIVTGWDPIGGAAQDLSLSLKLTRVASAAKSVRFILVDVETPALPLRIGGTSGPRYTLTSSANGTILGYPQNTAIDSTSAAALTFPTGTNPSVTVNGRFYVFANTSPVEDFIGGNAFTQRFWYTAQCLDAQGRVVAQDTLAPAGISISLTIPRLVTVATARPSTLDFGNFTATQQQLMLSVRSTSSFNVAVSTQNGGKMALQGAAAPLPDYATIPYTMVFGDRTIAPGGTLPGYMRAGVPGKQFPFKLTLTDGVPTGKLAGAYSDDITLTITPGQ